MHVQLVLCQTQMLKNCLWERAENLTGDVFTQLEAAGMICMPGVCFATSRGHSGQNGMLGLQKDSLHAHTGGRLNGEEHKLQEGHLACWLILQGSALKTKKGGRKGGRRPPPQHCSAQLRHFGGRGGACHVYHSNHLPKANQTNQRSRNREFSPNKLIKSPQSLELTPVSESPKSRELTPAPMQDVPFLLFFAPGVAMWQDSRKA